VLEEILGAGGREQVHEPRDDTRSSRLMARAEPGAVVPVEVLVEQNQIAPMAGHQPCRGTRNTFGQISGFRRDFAGRHSHSRSGMERPRAKDRRLSERADGAQGATLPYDKAFVVQFTAETPASLDRAAGRVEHLRTGRRSRFASIDEFLACIATLLVDHAKDAAKRGRRPSRKSPSSSSAPADRASPPP
jgi:hypothetical protein